MKNNIPTNVRPCEGYILEIDGKFESEYGTLTGALKAGFQLRQKFPKSQVKVNDANEQTPADEQSENKTEAIAHQCGRKGRRLRSSKGIMF